MAGSVGCAGSHPGLLRCAGSVVVDGGLNRILRSRGVAAAWSGWLAFKEFLKHEVLGLYDAASVQVRPEEDATSLFFVRQFTQRENRRADAADVLTGRLVVEFDYKSRPFPEQEIWTLDYSSLEEWASVVEGAPWFQALINEQPAFTDVYYDAGPG
jgi:hypothetical protein